MLDAESMSFYNCCGTNGEYGVIYKKKDMHH